MSVIIKNNTNSTRYYYGVPIAPGESKDLLAQGVDPSSFYQDRSLFIDFIQGIVSIADGEKDVLSPEQASILLFGHPDAMTALDGRLIVKPNVRPLGTSGYFTSIDDNMSVYRNVGGGSNISALLHNVGDPITSVIEHRFNVEGNRTWIYEGYLTFYDAMLDRFTFEIRPVVTPYVEQPGTNFKRHSTGVIIPAAGNGDVAIDVNNLTTLVSVVRKTDSGAFSSAYWNATLNPSTMKYENLTPAPQGNGKYNIFYMDVCLKRYIHSFVMLGSSRMHFSTADPSELGSNMRCCYVFTTYGNDHSWRACVNISMFREKIT